MSTYFWRLIKVYVYSKPYVHISKFDIVSTYFWRLIKVDESWDWQERCSCNHAVVAMTADYFMQVFS